MEPMQVLYKNWHNLANFICEFKYISYIITDYPQALIVLLCKKQCFKNGKFILSKGKIQNIKQIHDDDGTK